jgi:peptidoglycan/xylan/chitin deacetylase (PgdA/CDA1 family)
MVTFDDGYLDNHDVALPILLQHAVRATFFVATDYVERRRIYWWDRVNFVIKTSTRERLSLAYPEREVIALDGPDGPGGKEVRRAAVRRVQRIIKDRFGLDLERFLEGLERAAGVVLSAEDERAMADATVMTWNHVAALRRAGMDVQSHSHTHRVLETLSAAALEHELRASRSALENALGERVRAISYPVGRSLGDSAPMRRAVREAGYELGFSNATGTNRRRVFDPLDVRRISLEANIGDRFFRSMLALPWLSY